ncbi:unnamed protein product [Ascophyllum nodosum]
MGQRLRRVVEGHLPALAGVSEEGAAAEAEVLTEAEWTDLARCSHIVQAGKGGDSTGSSPCVGEKRKTAEISQSRRGGEVGTPDSRPSSPSSVAEEGAGASCTFEVSFDPCSGWSPGVCEVCMAAASERANIARSVFKLGLSFSGFPHNGVSVFGGLTPMPTILSEAVLNLRPAFIWMDGGHPLLKLGVSASDLVERQGAIVADISVPRDGSGIQDETDL